MNIKIVATRTCNHRFNLEKELNDLGVSYEVLFAEDHPDVLTKYSIRHSPNIIIDDEIIYRGQPDEAELRELLDLS